jgi:hypothetical protein
MFILSMSLISKAFAPDSIFGRDRQFQNCEDKSSTEIAESSVLY